METVFLNEGLSDGNFSRMLDHMLSSLFAFTSHGCGWILKKKKPVEVRLVSHLQIRGSSYLALSSALQNLKYLLNIRNRDDNNCFLYCFIAVWHFKDEPSLHGMFPAVCALALTYINPQIF